MRKLLLGGTAIAAAALFAPTDASAQTFRAEANPGPQVMGIGPLNVRLGGYFRTFYSYVDQPGRSSAQNATGVSTGAVAGETRIGNSDFQHEVEVHVEAAGKAANGLRYGVSVEIEADLNRQAQVSSQTGIANPATGATTGGPGTVTFPVAQGTSSKNALTLDEVFGWLAGPFGQIRLGDEDTAWQLMAQGHITGFGVGGLDSGDFGDSVVGGNLRPQFNFTSDPGDNTKLIYLTPQFFGFDAGVSFAFNTNEGGLGGCDTTSTPNGNFCDRLSATAGFNTRRRNEIVGILRYRGTFGTFGVGAHVGYFGAQPITNTTVGANGAERINMGLAGVQATAFGLTVGAHGTFGEANANFIPLERDVGVGTAATRRDDRNMSSFMAGFAYNFDAFTIGGHYAQLNSAGNQSIATGGRRDRGFSVGANYRIAPGLDFIAEYNRIYRRESGFNFVTGGVNANTPAGRNVGSDVDVTVFLAGFRIAF